MNANIVKWDRRWHSELCVGCISAFHRGDSVVRIGCLTIHFRRECAEQYIRDSVELGIEPNIKITLEKAP